MRRKHEGLLFPQTQQETYSNVSCFHIGVLRLFKFFQFVFIFQIRRNCWVDTLQASSKIKLLNLNMGGL